MAEDDRYSSENIKKREFAFNYGSERWFQVKRTQAVITLSGIVGELVGQVRRAYILSGGGKPAMDRKMQALDELHREANLLLGDLAVRPSIVGEGVPAGGASEDAKRRDK